MECSSLKEKSNKDKSKYENKNLILTFADRMKLKGWNSVKFNVPFKG